MNVVAECAIPAASTIASVSLALEPVPTAPRQARSFTENALRRWGQGGDLVDAAVLVVSELATNAIRHGVQHPREGARKRIPDPGITLTLVLRSESVLIEVRDGSTALPAPRVAGQNDDCGRGLMIVETLADSWTCGSDKGGGKWVRASLLRSTAEANGD